MQLKYIESKTFEALFLSFNKTVCSIKTKPYITIIFGHLVHDAICINFKPTLKLLIIAFLKTIAF